MGVFTNVLGILKLGTGAAKIGRGGSTVDADLTTLENQQSATSTALTAEQAKVATLQRQVVPLARAVRVAMRASSTVGGIQMPSSAQNNPGFDSFARRFKLRLPSYRPATIQQIYYKRTGSGAGLGVFVLTTGAVMVKLYNSVGSAHEFISTEVIPDENAAREITFSVDRTPSLDTVTIYLDGFALGAALTSATIAGVSLDNSANAYLFGGASSRSQGELYEYNEYNRALSASEALSIAINGPGLADRQASQTDIYTSDFSVGVDGLGTSNVIASGNVDGVEGENDWFRAYPSTNTNLTRTMAFTPALGEIYNRRGAGRYIKVSFKYFIPAGQTNVDGIRFIAFNEGGSAADLEPPVEVNLNTTGTVQTYSETLQMPLNWNGLLYWQLTKAGNPTFAGVTGGADDLAYLKDISIKALGVVCELLANEAQSDTGQIFETSGNNNHAVLPSSGASVQPPPCGLLSVESVHIWNGTKEGQYLGLVNQPMIPAGARLSEVIIDIVEGTPVDGILGDGVDDDRYCKLADNTGLGAGENTLALAERRTDGTNRKLVWTPDQNFTGRIKATVYYTVPRV